MRNVVFHRMGMMKEEANGKTRQFEMAGSCCEKKG